MMKFRLIALAACAFIPAASAQQIQHRYDALERLTSVSRQLATTTYTYDAADNRSQVVTGPNIITGTAAGEWLLGTTRTELFYGLGGDDIIGGAYGADTVDGGTGWDQAVYSLPSEYTFLRQSNGSVVSTHTPSGNLESLSAMEGTWFFVNGDYYPLSYLLTPTNTFTGTSGVDVINGAPYVVDRINALGGDDLIAGNGGVDVIDGGPGNDGIYLGGPIGSYLFKKVTMGTVSDAAVHVIYLPNGDSELLINVESVYVSGAWYAINDLPY